MKGGYVKERERERGRMPRIRGALKGRKLKGEMEEKYSRKGTRRSAGGGKRKTKYELRKKTRLGGRKGILRRNSRRDEGKRRKKKAYERKTWEEAERVSSKVDIHVFWQCGFGPSRKIH